MTNGLSAAELAQIRADIASLLPDTCNILGITRTSDGAGGWTETAGTVTGGTAVPCRIDFAKGYGKEQISSAALMPYQSGVVSLAWDKTITVANQIQFGTTVYNVTGVNTDQSWKGVTRCSVERVP